jgi:hypothetical protein
LKIKIKQTPTVPMKEAEFFHSGKLLPFSKEKNGAPTLTKDFLKK